MFTFERGSRAVSRLSRRSGSRLTKATSTHRSIFQAALMNFDIVVTFPVQRALNVHGRNGAEGVKGSPRSSRCSTFKVELAYYGLRNASGGRRSGSVRCLLPKGSSSVNCLACSRLPPSPINNTPGHCAAKSHH